MTVVINPRGRIRDISILYAHLAVVDDVLPISTAKQIRITARATNYSIITRTAIQRIVCLVTVQSISACATTKGIVARATKQLVVACAAF